MAEYRKTETRVVETVVTDYTSGRITIDQKRTEARVVIEHTGGAFERAVPLSSLGELLPSFEQALDTLRKVALSSDGFVEKDAKAEVQAPEVGLEKRTR